MPAGYRRTTCLNKELSRGKPCYSGQLLILVCRQDGGTYFILDPIVPSSCQGQRLKEETKQNGEMLNNG